jgi:uncharacterized protein
MVVKVKLVSAGISTATMQQNGAVKAYCVPSSRSRDYGAGLCHNTNNRDYGAGLCHNTNTI